MQQITRVLVLHKDYNPCGLSSKFTYIQHTPQLDTQLIEHDTTHQTHVLFGVNQLPLFPYDKGGHKRSFP